MPPPVDLNFVHEFQQTEKIQRNPRTVFVETRDANMPLLNGALELLRRRVVPHTLVTVGPVDDLDPQAVRWTLSEHDEVAQVRAMMEAGVILSARPEASSDYQVVRALVAGLPAGAAGRWNLSRDPATGAAPHVPVRRGGGVAGGPPAGGADRRRQPPGATTGSGRCSSRSTR